MNEHDNCDGAVHREGIRQGDGWGGDGKAALIGLPEEGMFALR